MEAAQLAPWTAEAQASLKVKALTTTTAAAKIFNGIVTIQNLSGEHRTFRIATQKADAKFAPGKRIISILSGPDNTRDYRGFGFVDDAGVHVWRKQESALTLWYARLINVFIGGFSDPAVEALRDTYKVSLSKKCLKCNRELTTPESIELGIGPVCAEGY